MKETAEGAEGTEALQWNQADIITTSVELHVRKIHKLEVHSTYCIFAAPEYRAVSSFGFSLDQN